MKEFIGKLSEIKIPITITQIEMNKSTSDELLRGVPKMDHNVKIGYLYSITGVPIVTNNNLNDGEIKMLYSDGKYKTIFSIDEDSIMKSDFEMEYECDWLSS